MQVTGKTFSPNCFTQFRYIRMLKFYFKVFIYDKQVQVQAVNAVQLQACTCIFDYLLLKYVFIFCTF